MSKHHDKVIAVLTPFTSELEAVPYLALPDVCPCNTSNKYTQRLSCYYNDSEVTWAVDLFSLMIVCSQMKNVKV